MRPRRLFAIVCAALLGALSWCNLLGAGEPAADPTPRPRLSGQRDGKYFVYPALAAKLISPEQTPEEQAEADAAWQRLFEPVEGRSLEFTDEKGQPSNLMRGDHIRRQAPNWMRDPKEIAWFQRAKAALRERGAEFWAAHPKDVRRLIWLYTTMQNYPYYWQDVEAGGRAFAEWLNDRSSAALSGLAYDRKAKARWEMSYLSMRAEFFASTLLEPGAKLGLRRLELEERLFLELQRNKIAPGTPEEEVALRWTLLLRNLLDLAELYPKEQLGAFAGSPIYWLEQSEKDFPETYPVLKKAYLAAAKLSASDDMKDYAFAADEQPVEVELGKPVPGLKLTTLKNQNVDRRTWHGKVVLLDFWAFWCHSCLESMPHLKEIYDKYHAQGFEIYGVCFAEKSETPQKIIELMEKMEIPWDQVMRESLRKDRLGRIYSFTGLPQLMLLDKNGNLAGRNIYNYAELEAKIKELLAQEVGK